MERHGITAIQYVSLSQHDDERVSQETSSKAYLFLIKRLCQLRTLSENFNFIFTIVCRTSHTSHFDRNTLTLSFDMPTLWLVMQRERFLHVNVKWQKIIEKNNNEKENTNRTEPNDRYNFAWTHIRTNSLWSICWWTNELELVSSVFTNLID